MEDEQIAEATTLRVRSNNRLLVTRQILGSQTFSGIADRAISTIVTRARPREIDADRLARRSHRRETMLVSRLRGSRHNSRAGHRGWRRCSSFKYAQYSQSSRLATRAPRSGLMPRSTETGHLDGGAMTIDELNTKMSAEFAAVRTEMKAEFSAVRNEMNTKFAAVWDEMKTQTAGLEARITAEGETTRRHFDVAAEQFKAHTKVLADGIGRNTERLDNHEQRISAVETGRS
jgi:hypothetical protein